MFGLGGRFRPRALALRRVVWLRGLGCGLAGLGQKLAEALDEA